MIDKDKRILKKVQIGTGRSVAWMEIDCPHCNQPIPFQIESDVYPLKTRMSFEKSDATEQDILKMFSPRIRSKLDVQLEGNFAHIKITGKFSPKTFKAILLEVKGYGGQYVKGYFKLPLPQISEAPQ